LGFEGAKRFPSAAAAVAAGDQANQAALSYGEVDQHAFTPQVYSWNLDVQYEFKPSWVADIGYVGNRGQHLYTGTEYNVPVLAVPGVPGINNTNTAQPGVNCANTVANGGHPIVAGRSGILTGASSRFCPFSTALPVFTHAPTFPCLGCPP
jgi:hypothetical protein